MWEHLQKTDKPVVLYGMGDGADKVAQRLDTLGVPVAGVFANEGFVRGQMFRARVVTSYAEAKARFGEMIVLLCFGTHRPEVIEQVKRIASEQELYAPDVPVYGDGTFDRAFAKAHEAELRAVYDKLADAQSRWVFEDVTAYKLSGDIERLFTCQSPAEETFSLLGLGTEEIYLDLGAYTGDTVSDFVRRVGTYRAIHAVEPEAHAFRRLQKNTAALHDCYLYNVGIHSQWAQLPFAEGRGRGSAVGGAGARQTVDSVDNLLCNQPVTFIKMDVEGQEAAAIAGARRTIARCRPKMLVSAYHRVEDLFALPLQVLSLRADYRVYLRRQPCLPAWDVNYYFV